jgi:glucokinase
MTTTLRDYGVDIGGTNIRLGVVEDDLVVAQYRQPVGEHRSPQAIVALIVELQQQAMQEWGPARAVGVGAPGIVDPQAGMILKSPHFSEWIGFSARDAIAQAVGVPVALENDANAIAIGEARYGAGTGLTNFIMLTLGTGIGGGLVLRGELFQGDRGFAAEVGHMVIQRDGPACNCGGHGCWELFASASGLHRLIDASDDPAKAAFLEHFHGESTRVTPAAAYERALDGDLFAHQLWRQFGGYLGTGIASLMNVLGVEHFVIGGGIAAAWDFFAEATQRAIARHTYPENAAAVQLHRAQLGDDAGILGSAYLASRCVA